MSIEEIAELVIDKVQKNGAYIELDDDSFKNTITKYLNKKHQYDIEYTVMMMERKKLSGKSVVKEDYLKEIEKIENALMWFAEELAVCNKKELKHFV